MQRFICPYFSKISIVKPINENMSVSRRPHILVVDDDTTQGQAIAKGFQRAGLDATWCPSAAKALTMVNLVEIRAVVIDCMLPKMNGMDLATELNELASRKLDIYLMSGIYKDRSFIREAMQKTNANEFLIKPFDLPSLIEKVKASLNRTNASSSRPPWLDLYCGEPLNSTDLILMLSEDQSIMTTHLPMLYKCMCEAKLTGELQIAMNDGRTYTISYYDGAVFLIHCPDKETFFGALAVGFGFITPEQLFRALTTPGKKRLGEKLIESMHLSPHALQVILEEQLALRLSQTIGSGAVAVQWSTKSHPPPDCKMKPERLNTLIDDWVATKLNPDEIEAGFRPWNQFQADEQALGDYLIEAEEDRAILVPQLLSKFIHRELKLAQEVSAEDHTRIENRLDRLLKDFGERNHFQILGLSERAHANEVRKAFAELSPYYDPANLGSHAPAELKQKAAKIYTRFQVARDTLTDDMAREQYVNLLNTHRAQKRFEAEPLFNAAVIEMDYEQYESAANRFQKLIDQHLDFKDLKSYRIWAGLKLSPRYNAIRLEQISPEERQSPIFQMAKGVDYANKGQYTMAVKCFRMAFAVNPRLKLARKELKSLFKKLKGSSHHAQLLREIRAFLESTSVTLGERAS